LNKGADVNAKSNDGTSALMYAAWKGNLDIVRELLNKDADFNAKADNGSTALILAAKNGYVDVVQRLKATGALE